ncbi:MAG: hypothetical protein JWN73_2322 [Betaproteobacteria bacterium]|nr:hypothetical protein [Betaproteobacteria bacterium]
MHSSNTAPSAWQRGHSWRVPVRDLPWRRLPWILPVAIAVWVLALWAFGRFIASPAPPPEPPPLDTRIIELPPDPPPAPPAARAPPEPPAAKPSPVPVVPKAPPPPPQPRLAQEAVTAPAAPANPPPAAPSPTVAAPVPTPPAPPPPAPPSANPAQGRTGAYAIFQPAPEVPGELAEDATRYSTSVRFDIAADGNVNVELVPPTPNPRLNRFYLSIYKTWKYFPATENGKPVASSVTIRPRPIVEVK